MLARIVSSPDYLRMEYEVQTIYLAGFCMLWVGICLQRNLSDLAN